MSTAVAHALERRYSHRLEVRIEDVFALPPPSVAERLTRLYGPVIRLAPWLYGQLYHSLNHPRRYALFSAGASRRTREKLGHLLDAFRPDVIVSTHPLANRPLLDAVEATGRSIPVLALVSELVSVHVSWYEPRLSLLNTATTESFRAVLGLGADERQVRCVGLPVDERFGHVDLPAPELRASMGLNPDLFTALLIGGGEGAGGLEAIVRAVQTIDLPIQLIVVCGRNQALRQRLEQLPLRTPACILGFVETIPELMHAADVIVTKGGPQSIAEALVAGKPIILTQTLPGQEEGNGLFVESRGVGFRPGPVRQIVRNLARVATDPELRAWMTKNAIRHGRPRAAGQVAEMVMDLAELR